MNEAKPAGHEPTGFPILIEPELVDKIVEHKIAFDVANVENVALQSELAAVNKRLEALRDVLGHAATGIRIAERDLRAANDLPDETRMVIDTDARTVEFQSVAPRHPQAVRR